MTTGNHKAQVGLLPTALFLSSDPISEQDVADENAISELLNRNRGVVQSSGLETAADMLRLYVALYSGGAV
jgi:hypothetical protein